MTDAPHKCFTVSTTAYMRNLTASDLREECIAIHYQAPDEDLGDGRKSISLRAPVLIVSLWMGERKAIADRAAEILNDHWDESDSLRASAKALRDAGELVQADYQRIINRIDARKRLRDDAA